MTRQPIRTWLVIFALVTTTRVGRASQQASLPIAVVFDASASDLPQREIRAAVGQELDRPVRADAEPSAEALFVSRDAEGNLVIRYRPRPSDLEQTTPVASAGEDIARRVALAATTLLAGAHAAAQVPEPRPANRTSVGTPQQPPSVPSHEPQSGLYVRLSLAAGFADSTYVYQSASGFPLEAGFTGPHLGVNAAFGHKTASGLVFGAELGTVANGPLSNQGNLANYAIGPFALRLQAGPFLDFYPNDRGRLHLQAGVGVARYFFQHAVAACGVTCGAPLGPRDAGRIAAPLWGGSAYLGIAYDLGARPGGAGWFARTSLGYFADDRVTMIPLELSVGAAFAWF